MAKANAVGTGTGGMMGTEEYADQRAGQAMAQPNGIGSGKEAATQRTRLRNFNPGPAALPLEVLLQAQEELVEYRNEGMSLMEMSHRSPAVEQMLADTERLLAELLDLPADFRVLFMGGGASQQFATVPMNFLKPGRTGRYVVTGSFAEKALKEAQAVGDAAALEGRADDGDGENGGAAKAERARADQREPAEDGGLPDLGSLRFDPADTAYVHMTTNNTIEGTQFRHFPDTGEVPLIGDMTSELLSRRVDWSRFAMVYAAAQKNLGPAGVTVAVVRESLLRECNARIPAIFNYAVCARNRSLYNTPPVHAIFMMKLMLEWTARQGGVAELEKRNAAKAGLLYAEIDNSGGFYRGAAARRDRSRMNVTWRMANEALEEQFVREAREAGFDGLAGHRSVGGMRASIYNAVDFEACEALADFMTDFRRRNG